MRAYKGLYANWKFLNQMSSWLWWIKKSRKQQVRKNAVLWAFQLFDCHIKNHSPAIVINTVNQSNTPRDKPRDVYFFPLLNPIVSARNLIIILKTPSHISTAIDNSHEMMMIKNRWWRDTLLIDRQPFLSFENISFIWDIILINCKFER